jgi:spore coat protein CotH
VKASLLGLPKESDWVLYAPYADKTLMRDVLAYELSNAMGRYAPRTRFVEVFIDRSGGKLARRDYMGVYVLVEKIKRDKNRVNIAAADDSAARTTDPSFIIKRDHSDRYEPSFRTGRGNHFFYVYPDPEEMSREQMSGISRHMSRVEASIYGDEFRDPAKGYAAFLDVGAFIDQHLLIEMSKNIDGFRYSAFVHRDRGGKVVVGPAWDWNLSFGNADYYDASDPTGWYTDQLRESEICWYRRLSEDPEFMQRTIDRWGELRRSVFATGRVLGRVDEIAAQLNEAQERNFTRWPIMGRRVNPNEFVGDSYAEEVKWMKQWIQRRMEWMDRQFPAAPVISEAQGVVTLKNGSGKIYYTLDGSDPRLPGGGVSRKAVAYSAPLKSSEAGKLTARAHRGNTWSAPVSVREK